MSSDFETGNLLRNFSLDTISRTFLVISHINALLVKGMKLQKSHFINLECSQVEISSPGTVLE